MKIFYDCKKYLIFNTYSKKGENCSIVWNSFPN